MEVKDFEFEQDDVKSWWSFALYDDRIVLSSYKRTTEVTGWKWRAIQLVLIAIFLAITSCVLITTTGELLQLLS